MMVKANCNRSARTASGMRISGENLARLRAVLVLHRENGFHLRDDVLGACVVHPFSGGVTPIEQHREVTVAWIDLLHSHDRLNNVLGLAALAISVVIVEHEVN